MKIKIKDLKKVINEASKTAKATTFVSPASKLKRITDALKKIGLVVASREQSPGVTKAWMKGNAARSNVRISAREVAATLNAAGIDCRASKPKYAGAHEEVSGPDFHMEVQNDDMWDRNGERNGEDKVLYVGVYKGGRRGEEERMGIDTADLGEADDMGDTGGMYMNEADQIVDEVLDELDKKKRLDSARRRT